MAPVNRAIGGPLRRVAAVLIVGSLAVACGFHVPPAGLVPRPQLLAHLAKGDEARADGGRRRPLRPRDRPAAVPEPPHVSQYVKRIYRKLDVASRVALTRQLLDLRDAARRA